MQPFQELSKPDDRDVPDDCNKETLNAFHIISLSQGIILSPLFREGKGEEKEMRFATASSTSSVVTELEEVAAKTGKFSVKRNSYSSTVRLLGEVRGRKERLAIAADIFAVAPYFSVVEVKTYSDDTLEYNQFDL